jgi:hypothetical protein
VSVERERGFVNVLCKTKLINLGLFGYQSEPSLSG